MFLEDGLNLPREDQHGRRVIKMSRFINFFSSYICYMLTTSRNYTCYLHPPTGPSQEVHAVIFLCFVMELKKPKPSIFMGLEVARKEYF